MKIGDRIFVRGYIDEIRKDTVIVRNDGGYFGTTWNEVTPSAQQERKTGNWTRISMDKYTQHAQAWYRCSECQGEFIGKWNFCPNCGADMRGGQQDDSF